MKDNGVLARENRIMINAIKGDIQEIRKDIGNIYNKLEKTYNHMSTRLPPWASILFMILTAIIGGIVGKAVL